MVKIEFSTAGAHIIRTAKLIDACTDLDYESFVQQVYQKRMHSFPVDGTYFY